MQLAAVNSDDVADTMDDRQILEVLGHEEYIYKLILLQGGLVNDSCSHIELLVHSIRETSVEDNAVEVQILLSDGSLLSEAVEFSVFDCFAHI